MARQFFELTPEQESIWLEEKRYPDHVNAGFFSVTIRGEIAPRAIEAACAAVCATNPDLRAVFPDLDGPKAVVLPLAETFVLHREVLPCAPGTERDAARRWYLERGTRAWRVTEHPPIRLHLLDHGPDVCTLVVGVHHICFDGRSKFVFARQFARALERARRGLEQPAESWAPPVRADDDRLSEAVDHWLGHDLPRLPALALPRPHRLLADGAVVPSPRHDLPEQVTRALVELTATEGVSVFSGLFAGAAAQLGRYGNERLVISLPVDTSVADTAERIGLQVNVVPTLVELSPDTSFRELLHAGGAAMTHVRRFRRTPFRRVVDRLRRACGVDVGAGVFDHFGISHPRTTADLGQVPGLALEWDFFAPNSTRSFDLTLQVRREPGAVYGRLDYATSVFDETAAREFMAGYAEVLDRVTREPDTPLGTLLEHRAAHVPPSHATPAPAGERIAFADLAGLLAAGDPPGTTVRCPMEEFQPTAEAIEFARCGRLLLTLVDERAGLLGWTDDPGDDPAAVRAVAARPDLIVVGRNGVPVPPMVTGVLCVGAPERRTPFRARLDGEGGLWFHGRADECVDVFGRLFDRAEARRRVAGLPGVREVAVLPDPDARDSAVPRPLVCLAVAEPEAGVRVWRQAVRRVWPRFAPPPSRFLLFSALPRNGRGEIEHSSGGMLGSR
jgi:hypothetical protein